LQSIEGLSMDAVVTPFAFTVTWISSRILKFGVDPCATTRVFTVSVIVAAEPKYALLSSVVGI